MVKPKPEQMSVEELRELIQWYESRVKYLRFLLSEKGA